MYAIFQDGAFQYTVQKGDFLTIARRNDLEVGATIEFKEVLSTVEGESSEFGTPFLPVVVKAEVTKHYRGDKIRVGKKKAKKRYERIIGHRQDYTEVKITAITKK